MSRMWIAVAKHVRAVLFASVGLAFGFAAGSFGGAMLGAVSLYRAAYGESMDAILQMTNRGVAIKWGPNDEDEDDDCYLFRDVEDESESDTDTDEETDSDEVDTEQEAEESEVSEESEEDRKKSTAPPTSLRDAIPQMRPMSMRHLRQRRTSFLMT